MLRNLVVPHKKNNYRPHALRWYGVLAVLTSILVLQVIQNYQLRGTPSVLAYATSISASGLLSHTNSNRSASGLAPLTLSSSLNSAAQSKAQHMINNDYWAHIAPDGTTPWDFINATGYSYLKAGENLAFGYATSSATVTGWMNSPAHRDNILTSAYENVGFGIANGASFQGGENTVVVAMYADPKASPSSSTGGSSSGGSSSGGGSSSSGGSSSGSSSSGSGSSSQPSSTQTPQQQNDQTTTTTNPPATTEVTEEIEDPAASNSSGTITLTPAKIDLQTSSINVTNLEAMVDGQAHWTLYAMTMILAGMGMVYAYRHLLFVQSIVVRGEHIMHSHPLLEATAVYALLWFMLSASFGVTL